MSELSVIVATRRRPQQLAGMLKSLAAMDTAGLRWELLVVDNGGDPETARVVGEAAAALPVRLLTEVAPGKNRAINRALPEAAGGLIAFTDDDVRVDPHWLRELSDGASRWPAASMFGGRVLPQWPAGQAPPAPHPFHDHAYAIADFAHPEGPYSSGYVYGPNMAIRASVFAQGWAFNPDLGPDGTDRYVTGSETSLTVALEQRGHQAVYLPGALVHHQVRDEQLTPRWLYGRAFRMGRSDAVKRGWAGGWRRVPRDLVATAWREYREWLRCRWRDDGRGTLDHGLAYWRARGAIHHCRVTDLRTEVASPQAPRFRS